jgi:hypothetical protein
LAEQIWVSIREATQITALLHFRRVGEGVGGEGIEAVMVGGCAIRLFDVDGEPGLFQDLAGELHFLHDLVILSMTSPPVLPHGKA